MANNRAKKANINAIMGASGSGKTSFVMAEIKRLKPSRLLIWDKKGEFEKERYGMPVNKMADVYKLLLKAGAAGSFKICYRPRGDQRQYKEQFDRFCKAAFASKNLLFVAEELSDVTTASHAPAGWRELTTQGRTEGIIIYGLSQSPAQIDKDFFGNSTLVRTGRLNFDSHIKAMANCMSADKEIIRNLLAGEYIERNMDTGQVKRGKLF